MLETYYAAVYWGCRVESAEECAHRAELFFRLLSRCDPDYTRWFEQAESRKKALQLQFDPTAATFASFFKKRRYKLGKIGFILGAWTGHEGRERGGIISLTCGDDAVSAPNNCLLYLPREEPGAERVLTASILSEVMRAMVLAWEPDWGVVTSDDLRDTLSEKGRTGTFVGWMTYLSRARGEVPPLPAPLRVEPVEDKGALIHLTSERATVTHSEQVTLARRVQEFLRAKGLLEPVVSRRPVQ
jgi:hypothetical protein